MMSALTAQLERGSKTLCHPTRCWPTFCWRRSHWTRVDLEIETGAWPEDPNAEDPDYFPVLAVKVLNRSHFPIRVMGAGAGPTRVINSVAPLRSDGMPQVRNAVIP